MAILQRSSLAGMLHPYIHQFHILYNGPIYSIYIYISININRNVVHVQMFFGLSLPSVQKSLYCFQFVQCLISIFLFTMYNFIICSFFLIEFLHQLLLYVIKYLHSSKNLLLFLPNLTFLSLLYLLSSLNSFFGLVFLYPLL